MTRLVLLRITRAMPTLEPLSTDPSFAPSTPGWYPDPVTDGRSDRWWTGEGWSGYSRARQAPAAPPPPSNGRARLSLLVGILAVLVSCLFLFVDGHVWVSSIGAVAVVLGIRALRLRSRGLATAFGRAVAGIVLGGVASVLMLVLALVHVVAPVPVSGSYSDSGPVAVYTAPPVASSPPLPTATPTPVPTATEAATPTPTASGPQVLEAVPRQPMPDDLLAGYTAGEIRSVTAATAGCGVLRVQAVPLPSSTAPRSEAREVQDFADQQLQAMRNVLVYGPQVTKPMSWPMSLDLDPETRVVFLPAPTCQPLGVLPKDDVLRFGISPDRGQIALAIWNEPQQTGDIWRSVDDTAFAL